MPKGLDLDHLMCSCLNEAREITMNAQFLDGLRQINLQEYVLTHYARQSKLYDASEVKLVLDKHRCRTKKRTYSLDGYRSGLFS